MSDQNAAAGEAAQQTADTPIEGTGIQEQQGGAVSENWEERYKEAQAWGTRNAQRAAELEAEAQLVAALRSDDPNEQRQALEALGYQVPDDEYAAEQAEQPLTRAEFQQFLAEQQAQTQQQEQAQQTRAVVDAQLQQWGLDEEDGNDVLAYAIHALPPTREGLPDIQAAYERFQQRQEAAQKKGLQTWRESKRAPHMSAAGTAGTAVPDLGNREARQQYALERFQSERQ